MFFCVPGMAAMREFPPFPKISWQSFRTILRGSRNWKNSLLWIPLSWKICRTIWSQQGNDGMIHSQKIFFFLSCMICGSNLTLSAIFFAPIRIFKSESVCAVVSKTRWHKGFYNIFPRVLKTHSDRKIRAFSPGFRPVRVWILRIPASPSKTSVFSQVVHNQQ